MKDRIPLNPGRVRLTPVAGETDLFDMEMADNPTELGTALNKANLLTDATAAALAAAFGSTPDTPNEALALLAGCANMEIQSYVGTGTVGASHKTTITFQHLPKFVIVIPTHDQSVGNYIYGAFLPWADVVAQYEASPSYCRIDTWVYHGSSVSYQRAARYTLSNSNKTISMWDASSSLPDPDPATQLNTSGHTYRVISFY